MIFISHRGNTNGPIPERENHPDYVLQALRKTQGVEIDVWYQDNNWALGHDSPTYEISKYFLLNQNFWCHAKNIEALVGMSYLGNHFFWHQEDDVSLTSKGYIWTYPGKKLTNMSIAVMPEEVGLKKIPTCAGICSDYIMEWKK